MKYQNLLRKLHWPAAALLLVLSYPATGWAQGGDLESNAYWRAKQLKEQQRLDNINRLAKGADVIDRAVAILGLSELEVETYNYGTLTGGNFGSSFRFSNVNGSRRNYMYVNEIAMAFKEGPWFSTAMVHENYSHDYSRYDWEAADGSRGDLYSDPPLYTYNFPTFAISDLESTWPEIGGKPTWPAPEGATEVWSGTTTWNKWKRAGDRNAYGEFTDSYADREGDSASQSMGIEAKYRAIAYSSANIVFFQYEFTNTSSNNYTDVFIGNLSDTGGPSTGDGGYLNYDEEHQVIWARSENYTSAGGGTHFRWDGTTPVSFVGTMYLESPTGSLKKDGTGAYVGNEADVLTRVALLPYSYRIDRASHGEEAVYGAFSGDVSYMTGSDANLVWKTSLPGGPIMKQSNLDMIALFSKDEDCWFYASSGPFDFPAGSSINFVLAAVAGYTEADMFEAADKAISMFNAQFAGPAPPARPSNVQVNGVMAGPAHKDFNPVIHAYPINYCPSGNITLSWDLTDALTNPDAASGAFDFEGVRIYRSEDRGDSWGTRTIDPTGKPGSWIPAIQWDLDNGITGLDGLSDSYLGDDTGIVSSWTDPNALDGIEYWYAITTYDQGEFAGNVQTLRSLESTRGDDPNFPTLVAAVAGSQPNGYSEGMIGSGTTAGSRIYLYNENAPATEASIYVDLVSEAHITGDSYSIALTNYAMDSAGDTTYASLLTAGSGDEELVTGITLRNTTTSSVLFESRVSTLAALGTESHPVTEGFRVVALDPNDGQPGVYDYSHDESLFPDSTSSWAPPYLDMQGYGGSLERVIYNNAYWDFEVRWGTTNASGDTNMAIQIDTDPRSIVMAPFEIWNITTNTRVWPAVPWWRNGPDWDHGWEEIIITNVPYADNFFTGRDADNATGYWTWDESDPANSYTDMIWWVGMDNSSPNTWYLGETWRLTAYKPLAADLSISIPSFTSTAPTIDESLIDYDEIRAVPNPYLITAKWDQTINRRKIQFTNVPVNATVDIYTLAGELVCSLDHGNFVNPDTGTREYNSTQIGTVEWKIWTYEFTEAAYGLYIYVVKVGGDVKKVGKLAIIR